MKNKSIVLLIPLIAGLALAGTGFGAWIFAGDLSNKNLGAENEVSPAVDFKGITMTLNDADHKGADKPADNGDGISDVYLDQLVFGQNVQPGKQNISVALSADAYDGIDSYMDAAEEWHHDDVAWTDELAGEYTVDYKITWSISSGLANYIHADITPTYTDGTCKIDNNVVESGSTVNDLTSSVLKLSGSTLSYSDADGLYIEDSDFDFDYNWAVNVGYVGSEDDEAGTWRYNPDTSEIEYSYYGLLAACNDGKITYNGEISAIYHNGKLIYGVEDVSNKIEWSKCWDIGSARTSATTAIVGRESDYESEIAGLDGMTVDEDDAGTIKAYYNESTNALYALINIDSDIVFEDDDNITFTYSDGQTRICGPFVDFESATTLKVEHADLSAMSCLDYLFGFNSALTSIDLSSMTFSSKCTSTTGLFYEDSSLESIAGLDHLNTTNSTWFDSMFYNCTSLTEVDVSSLSTSNATTMEDMFSGDTKLASISGLEKFNTANVTNMSEMFNECTSLTELDLSSFDSTSLSSMGRMFYDCVKLETIYVSESFDVSNVQNSYGKNVFYNCTSLSGKYTCDDAEHHTFTYAYSDHTTNITRKYAKLYLYDEAALTATQEGYFTLKDHYYPHKDYSDKINWNSVWSSYGSTATSLTVGKYSDYKDVVASGFTKTIVDEENAGTINSYYNSTTNALYVLTNSDTKPIVFEDDDNHTYLITQSDYMECGPFAAFDQLTSLSIDAADFSSMTKTVGLFAFDVSLSSIDISNINFGSIKSANTMFFDDIALTSISGLDQLGSSITDMSWMFAGCMALTSLDVSELSTSNVSTMESMFQTCMALTSITGLENFDTSSVTSMKQMFLNCSSLTSLDLRNFNTAKVTDMSMMFGECSALATIYASSSFDITNVTSSADMFTGCTSLSASYSCSAGHTYTCSYDSSKTDASMAQTFNVSDETFGTMTEGYFTEYTTEIHLCTYLA